MKKKLAVTGGTGFIGRPLIKAALDRGWTVLALARDASRLPVADGLTYVEWDALNSFAMENHLRGTDAVCHLAAMIPPDLSDPSYAEQCFRVNVLGTLGLLAASTRAGVGRFVFLSSGAAYASATGPVGENHALYPSGRAAFYLSSKVAADALVDHWRQSGRLATCILRIASVYGPGMSGGVIRTFSRNLQLGERVRLRDGGRYAADLVFLDDVVEAILAAASGTVVGPINVGSGVRTSTGALVDLLLELTGAPATLVEMDPEPAGPVGSLGPAALDISRARLELGYSPTDLREGLRRTIGVD